MFQKEISLTIIFKDTLHTLLILYKLTEKTYLRLNQSCTTNSLSEIVHNDGNLYLAQ